jgi:hypothetical protein
MIPYVTKDDLKDKIIKRIKYANIYWGGHGPISTSPITKRKHVNQEKWYAIGDIGAFENFNPWWDVYLDTQEKINYLRTILKEICEEAWIHYEL